MDKTEAIEIPRETPYEQGGSRPEPPTGQSTHTAPEIIRPTGISWVTLTLGLLCLGVAALVLTLQLAEVTIDWSSAGPVFVVSAGSLLVIAGIASMVSKGRQDT